MNNNSHGQKSKPDYLDILEMGETTWPSHGAMEQQRAVRVVPPLFVMLIKPSTQDFGASIDSRGNLRQTQLKLAIFRIPMSLN
jgi:hypothetical protein